MASLECPSRSAHRVSSEGYERRRNATPPGWTTGGQGETGPSCRPGDPRLSAVRAHLEARDIVLAHRAGVAIGEARRPRTPRIDEDGAGREAVRFAQETRRPGRLRLARLARLSRPCRIAGAGGAGSNGEGEARPMTIEMTRRFMI